MASPWTLVAVATLLAAAPAAAQLRPSAPEAVAAAAVDCWQASAAGRVNEQALRDKGWSLAKLSSKDGKEVASPVHFYGRTGGSVMLLVTKAGQAPSCAATALVASVADANKVGVLLVGRLKEIAPDLKAGPKDGGIYYIGGNRIAMLQPAGNKDKPGVRFIVGYKVPEKK